ncbi:MAG TPA: cytochrome P460 family protein [Candidatus Xenobia bacterium]|nr:cytochrome P460 family protein [Candidatus Xenobia bacterium]
MKKILTLALGLTAFVLLAGPRAWTQADKGVAYPQGYRQWTHVKSMVIGEGHPLYAAFGGIHHVYANPPALNALKKGKAFPDGSALVFDLLEATSEGHAVVEGPRKVVGVMQKDSKRFRATGGWGFEGFKGDTRERVVKDPAKECFGCHKTQAQSDYVFSKFRQ